MSEFQVLGGIRDEVRRLERELADARGRRDRFTVSMLGRGHAVNEVASRAGLAPSYVELLAHRAAQVEETRSNR